MDDCASKKFQEMTKKFQEQLDRVRSLAASVEESAASCQPKSSKRRDGNAGPVTGSPPPPPTTQAQLSSQSGYYPVYEQTNQIRSTYGLEPELNQVSRPQGTRTQSPPRPQSHASPQQPCPRSMGAASPGEEDEFDPFPVDPRHRRSPQRREVQEQAAPRYQYTPPQEQPPLQRPATGHLLDVSHTPPWQPHGACKPHQVPPSSYRPGMELMQPTIAHRRDPSRPSHMAPVYQQIDRIRSKFVRPELDVPKDWDPYYQHPDEALHQCPTHGSHYAELTGYGPAGPAQRPLRKEDMSQFDPFHAPLTGRAHGPGTSHYDDLVGAAECDPCREENSGLGQRPMSREQKLAADITNVVENARAELQEVYRQTYGEDLNTVAGRNQC